MADEFEGRQFGRIVGRSAQDLTIGHDGGEEARWRALALRSCNGLKGPGHVDEVLLGPLAGMVRPRAGIRGDDGSAAAGRRSLPFLAPAG
jgi:hypothetical protein